MTNDIAPKGLERVAVDTDAIWDDERGIPMHGRLLECRLSEGDMGLQVLWIFESLSETAIRDKEDSEAMAEPGTILGVWGSAGLRVLKDHGGAEVWIKPLGRVNLDKKRTFKRYDIRVGTGGKRVRVIDNRPRATKPEGMPQEDIDNLPF